MQHSPNNTDDHADRLEGIEDVDEEASGCVVED
jgi:hypothetical protein